MGQSLKDTKFNLKFSLLMIILFSGLVGTHIGIALTVLTIHGLIWSTLLIFLAAILMSIFPCVCIISYIKEILPKYSKIIENPKIEEKINE
jgi:hypothetical protein